MGKFECFREKYPEFLYEGFDISEKKDRFEIAYRFQIKDLSEFRPTWVFPKDASRPVSLTDPIFRQLVFSLGMVELVSYWKITCSPKVTIRAGAVSPEQAAWWKKQYFYGLGEFFYKNGIQAKMNSFMEILSEGEIFESCKTPEKLDGCLIPIGGGKDSIVTLELLQKSKAKNKCFIINPRGATVLSAKTAGYSEEQIVSVNRTLDPNMIALNKHGFLNGHTPFSALIAFSAVLEAYLIGKKYVVLSNESSANESTVADTDINHQYSKSFQFEKDFHNYEKKFIGSGVYYFSLLRPWSELQIAAYFSSLKAYHAVFKSCNVGSKKDIWCANCSKCLFVFLILSPFLSTDELTSIFGRNLLQDKKMIPIMEQLIGAAVEKPFECVGSREEINTAICLAVRRKEKAGEPLPLLLNEYKNMDFYRQYQNFPNPYPTYFNHENLLPEEFELLLRAASEKTLWKEE